MRGFTLIELIAVVALIALATAIVLSTTTGGIESARIRAASKELVAALRYTRTQAITKRESQALTIDVEQRSSTAPGRKTIELPRQLELKLLTAAQEQVDDGVGRIRVFPDGASTGGHVELIYGDARWRIDVNWLTGEVLLQPLGQTD